MNIIVIHNCDRKLYTNDSNPRIRIIFISVALFVININMYRKKYERKHGLNLPQTLFLMHFCCAGERSHSEEWLETISF